MKTDTMSKPIFFSVYGCSCGADASAIGTVECETPSMSRLPRDTDFCQFSTTTAGICRSRALAPPPVSICRADRRC